MCGISGKLFFTDTAVAREDLMKMTAALAHRGPDDTGWYQSPNSCVGFGHNRLAIIDPSLAGHQPMRYLNRYVITFNGEIYNHATLRQTLVGEGYSFASTTDTEVIMALYDKHGPDCLQHLDGMFAFALYDEHTNILFCARDRLGEKPFKYYHDANVFIFASEIKALLTQRECPRRIDHAAINHYLTLQYVPAPLTGYQNICKLPAAHYLLVNGATGAVEEKRYWQPSLTVVPGRSRNEWAADIAASLERAVTARLMSDVPLGAFLSGGLDSSIIVALMQRHSAAPVKTFSIGFAETAHSEAMWAKRVSRHLGTDHTELTLKPDVADIVLRLTKQLDEPFADSSYLPTYFVSQLARQKVTVALTGDGADEVFAGYKHYAAHEAAEFLTHVPGAVVAAGAVPALSARWRRWQEGLRMPSGQRHAHLVAYLTRGAKEILYQPAYRAAHALPDTYQLLAQHWASPVSSVVAAQYTDTLTYLPEDILMKTDFASMANSLEARAPFVDHHLVELAYTMPATFKMRGWQQQKYILKYIATSLWAGLLPIGVTKRPKHGFTIPLAEWLRDDLHEVVSETLLGSQARARGMFNPAAVERLLGQLAEHTEAARPIWALFMLEQWLQNYVD